ncbi:MAG: hypothetical protein D6798_11165, partial [Deltaproteobacteria bacterium]
MTRPAIHRPANHRPAIHRVAPALVGGWYALLVVALTWPVVLHPGEAALGSARSDTLKHLWTLWWMRTSVWQEHALPFHTRMVNYPVGMDLFPIEPLNGLVAILLPFVPLVLMSNLLVFANLWGLGLAGHLLGRELGGGRSAGLAAGTMLLCSSVAAFTVHVGVGELLHLWWLPLGMVATLRIGRGPAVPATARLAGCLVGAVLSSFYIGLFLIIALACWSLTALLPSRPGRRQLPRIAAAAAVSLAVILPVVHAFSVAYGDPDMVPPPLLERLLTPLVTADPAAARVEPWQLLSPGRTTTEPVVLAYGGGRYLGILATALALLGWVVRPRAGLPWAVIGATGVVLSLGSRLTWAGAELGPPMPFAALNQLLAVVAEPVNFPVRFLALTVTAQAALVSLIGRWPAAPLAAVAALEVVTLQMLPHPWQTLRPTPFPGLEDLAEQEGAVLDLTQMWTDDRTARQLSLCAQMVHSRPIQAVSVERMEFFARQGRYYAQALRLYPLLEPAWEDRAGEVSPAVVAAPLAEDRAILYEDGFRWILVTERAHPRPVLDRMTAVLEPLLGAPWRRTDQFAVWAIEDPDLDPATVARARALHRQRQEAIRRADAADIPLVPPKVP